MIDQKANRQERLLDILLFLSLHSNTESYDVWRAVEAVPRHRPRVSSETIAKDLKYLHEQGYVVRASDVRHGLRRYSFTLTLTGLRVCQEKEEGHAPVRL